VDNNGIIKLADFGASKKLQGLLNSTGGLRSLKGTPYYMAPEVIRQTGHGKYAQVSCLSHDFRQADVWSVGCTVFEMFTGKPPWCDIEDQVSAMFHIASSNSGPVLPDTLVHQSKISSAAQDFLSLCFKRLKHHPAI
jgi:serine/threonine protein kinase